MSRIARRLRRPIDDRGAVAVEAALITPVLILLIFGAIEFTLLLRDHVATTSLVRVGARIASAEPRQGTVASCQSLALTPACFAQDAADAMQRSGSALPKNSIEYILVYRANKEGYPGSDGNTSFENCPGNSCYKFTWQDGTGGSAGRFAYAGGAWNPQSINACQGDPNAMAVGVYMKVKHPAVIGLFFNNFTLTDHAVMKFEPMQEGVCK